MPPSSSVGDWLKRLQAGDSDASRRLWADYFDRLAAVARRTLRGRPRRSADEEDMALSALYTFCARVRDGRLAPPDSSARLWALLVVITQRKALDYVKKQNAQKAGGGRVKGESALPRGAGGEAMGFDQVPGSQPTPESVARLLEGARRLLDSLGSPDLKMVALWKLERYTNDEIAAKLGRSRATVERKLRLIRRIWEGEADATAS